jgi:hypothetical protein
MYVFLHGENKHTRYMMRSVTYNAVIKATVGQVNKVSTEE